MSVAGDLLNLMRIKLIDHTGLSDDARAQMLIGFDKARSFAVKELREQLIRDRDVIQDKIDALSGAEEV